MRDIIDHKLEDRIKLHETLIPKEKKGLLEFCVIALVLFNR